MPTRSEVSADSMSDHDSSARDKRQRILDAAVQLATDGGFDAVQMREVADIAEVALGTLYRYFPSKNDLLLGVWAEKSVEINHALKTTKPTGSARERVTQLILMSNSLVMGWPRLTQAVIHGRIGRPSQPEAFLANPLSPMAAVLGRAIEPERDASVAYQIGLVVVDVWISTTVQWAAGRMSPDVAVQHLELAVKLLLPD